MAEIASELETIRAQVAARAADEGAAVPVAPVTVAKSGIDSRFIMTCLANNERGDGLLYSALHRDKFVYVKRSASWLWWNGVHWEDDKRGLAWFGVEEVATTYHDEAAKVLELLSAERTAKADAENGGDAARVTVATSCIAKYMAEHKALMRRVQRLRGKKGVLPTLDWSHHIGPDSLCIIGDEIDQQPWLLPCKNGVVDLRNGKLRPGDPHDYIVTSIPIDFPECEQYLFDGKNSPCPTWEKFIAEIHPDKNGAPDHDVIDFIQRLFGYSITGLTTEHYIGTFVGDGRNGKGTMFETIRLALGGLAWAIQPELLLEQKNPRSSAGPSADLMSLYGKRFVIASETDAGRRISGSKVKSLTGSDTITARTPNDKFEINFRPSHTLFLYTNEPPWGLTADFALRQRLLFIEYPLRYVDDPDAEAQRDPSNAAKYRQKNPDLPAQLMAELPGIVAWLVRGCLLWQQHGIKPPDTIRKAAERLSEDEDYLQQYLSACCSLDNPSSNIYFRDLFAEFDAWYQAEIDNRAGKCRSKRWLGLQLRKKGYLPGKDGDRTYHGITITRNYVKAYP